MAKDLGKINPEMGCVFNKIDYRCQKTPDKFSTLRVSYNFIQHLYLWFPHISILLNMFMLNARTIFCTFLKISTMTQNRFLSLYFKSDTHGWHVIKQCWKNTCARCVAVIVRGNRDGKPSSKPGRSCLSFTFQGKAWILIFLIPSGMNKYWVSRKTLLDFDHV